MVAAFYHIFGGEVKAAYFWSAPDHAVAVA
jgi:hypothetical protein